MTPVPARILPAIAVSQFAGTSVWFAINAVMADLQRERDELARLLDQYQSAGGDRRQRA